MSIGNMESLRSRLTLTVGQEHLAYARQMLARIGRTGRRPDRGVALLQRLRCWLTFPRLRYPYPNFRRERAALCARNERPQVAQG